MAIFRGAPVAAQSRRSVKSTRLRRIVAAAARVSPGSSPAPPRSDCPMPLSAPDRSARAPAFAQRHLRRLSAATTACSTSRRTWSTSRTTTIALLTGVRAGGRAGARHVGARDDRPRRSSIHAIEARTDSMPYPGRLRPHRPGVSEARRREPRAAAFASACTTTMGGVQRLHAPHRAAVGYLPTAAVQTFAGPARARTTATASRSSSIAATRSRPRPTPCAATIRSGIAARLPDAERQEDSRREDPRVPGQGNLPQVRHAGAARHSRVLRRRGGRRRRSSSAARCGSSRRRSTPAAAARAAASRSRKLARRSARRSPARSSACSSSRTRPGPAGQKVRRLLIEEGADIKKELYVGMVVDRAHAARRADGELRRRHGHRGSRREDAGEDPQGVHRSRRRA